MLEAVADRLKAQVASISRAEAAVDLSDLLEKKAIPETSTTYVLPLGLQARAAAVATGLFSQEVAETIGVLLIERTRSKTGARAYNEIRATIFAVIEAIGGWTADPETLGVFELRRGTLMGIQNGAIIYLIEFSITDQLRITS